MSRGKRPTATGTDPASPLVARGVDADCRPEDVQDGRVRRHEDDDAE
jgi:hypothetical protein